MHSRCINWGKYTMLVIFKVGAELGNLLVADCVSMPSVHDLLVFHSLYFIFVGIRTPSNR